MIWRYLIPFRGICLVIDSPRWTLLRSFICFVYHRLLIIFLGISDFLVHLTDNQTQNKLLPMTTEHKPHVKLWVCTNSSNKSNVSAVGAMDGIYHFTIQLTHNVKHVELTKTLKLWRLHQYVSFYKETIIREPQPVLR